MNGFISRMIAEGKMTADEYAAIETKREAKAIAKETYKAKKSTLKKADMEALLDVLTED